jgi:hypothetical protein
LPGSWVNHYHGNKLYRQKLRDAAPPSSWDKLAPESETMPSLILSVSHRLSQDEALRRIKAVLAQAKVQYSGKISDLHESWNGYLGAFEASGMGQKGSGTIAVNPTDVTVQITLPFAVSLFKSKIESGIRDTLARILA